MRAFTRPKLRPYLPDLRFVRAVGQGSLVLCRCAVKPLVAGLRVAFAKPAAKPTEKAPENAEQKDGGTGAEEKASPVADGLERLAAGALVLAAGGAATVTVLSGALPRLAPYLPVAAAVGVPVWIVAAWVVAPPAAPRKPPAAPVEAPAMPREEAIRVALIRYLDVHTRGRNGIHLAELHQRLTQTEAYAALSKAEVGPLLEANGVPTVRSLTVGGVSGRTGVRRADVMQLLSPDPQAALSAPSRPVSSFSDLGISRLSLADSRPAESGSESS
jgi:hypothetical protein